jgi:hypothetical protein
VNVELGDMRQTITINRQVRDYLFKANFDQNAPLGVYLEAIGPEIDPANPGTRFYFKAWFPRCKFLEKPYQVTDGKWVESGSLLVMKDKNALTVPTAMFEVQNEVAGDGYVEA